MYCNVAAAPGLAESVNGPRAGDVELNGIPSVFQTPG